MMKKTILTLTILLVSSTAQAQYYEYPGPPMGTWRNPCAYGPGPDCPGHRHREFIPMPRPRPRHFGPMMPDCIENGYCGPYREGPMGPPPMPPFPEY